MIKTLTMGGKEVRFSTALSWVWVYKGQFGRDPLFLLMPVVKSLLTVVPSLIEAKQAADKKAGGEAGALGVAAELTGVDLDQVTDALFELELQDILNLVWAFAKNADPDLPEPEKWYQDQPVELDTFLTKFGPEIIRSCISSKNWRSLQATFAPKSAGKVRSAASKS